MAAAGLGVRTVRRGTGRRHGARRGREHGVVVDTGPDPRLVDRCLRDLGITRVPLLLLTHFHADHVRGLTGALRGRKWVRSRRRVSTNRRTRPSSSAERPPPPRSRWCGPSR
ncbi:MBL fold metallo-hydrolase [Streptomyces sp. M10(2022)]